MDLDLDLKTEGRANLRAALEMLRGVAVAGEVNPAQLESCGEAADLVTKALGDLPTEELVAAHTKNLWVFRTGTEGSNWQEVRLRKLAATHNRSLCELNITRAIALVCLKISKRV